MGEYTNYVTAIATVVLAVLTWKYVTFTKGILDATNANQKLLIDEQNRARREGYLFNLIEAWNSLHMMEARIYASNRADKAGDLNLKDFLKSSGEEDSWYRFALVAHFIARVVTCVENNFITEEDAKREFPYLRWWSEKLKPTYASFKDEQRIVSKMEYVLRTFPKPSESAGATIKGHTV